MRASCCSIVGMLLVSTGLLAGPSVRPAAAQVAVVVVRHAERLDDSTDSPLSSEGRARASRLAQQLRSAQITSVFATQYVRTQETVRPLATLAGVPVETVLAADTPALIGRLRALGAHARALVAGHSDTVPKILAAFGCADPVTIAADEYDSLWVVVPVANSAPTCVRMRF